MLTKDTSKCEAKDGEIPWESMKHTQWCRLDLIGIPEFLFYLCSCSKTEWHDSNPSAFCRNTWCTAGMAWLETYWMPSGCFDRRGRIISSLSSKPADSGFQMSFKWKLSIFVTLFKLFGESIPVINGFFQGHELQRTMTSSSPILGPQSPLFPRRPGSDRRIGCLHQEEPHHWCWRRTEAHAPWWDVSYTVMYTYTGKYGLVWYGMVWYGMVCYVCMYVCMYIYT